MIATGAVVAVAVGCVGAVVTWCWGWWLQWRCHVGRGSTVVVEVVVADVILIVVEVKINCVGSVAIDGAVVAVAADAVVDAAEAAGISRVVQH